MRLFVSVCCALGAALALAVGERTVAAWSQPSCDFITGAGKIHPMVGTTAKFGFAAGCKNGSGTGTPPAPFFGHLHYRDRQAYVEIRSIRITGYKIDDVFFPHRNARLICGVGKTDYDQDVRFVARAKDEGEYDQGYNEFDIQVTGAITYSTFEHGPHKVFKGDIDIHRSHKNGGMFGGDCPMGPPPTPSSPDVTVAKSTTTPTVTPAPTATPPPTVSFDLVVQNAGPVAATNVVLTDQLPTGSSVTSWTISPPVPGCSISATQLLTCSFPTLAAGASVAIHVQATPVCPTAPEALVNQATVSAANEAPPQQANNNSDIVTITVNACGE
jgi:uncharacterized repeat protein (TIGR01451 family)